MPGMEQSILKSTKKILGVDGADKAFDLDILTFINTAFSSLRKLGIGPVNGAYVEDDESTWGEVFADEQQIHDIKTYVYLRVKLLFDPPGTPHHITMAKEQIDELGYTMLTERNLLTWTPSSSLPSLL